MRSSRRVEVATLAALGYGLFDAFVLDTIVKGWRPNQFIDSQLVPFVSGSQEIPLGGLERQLQVIPGRSQGGALRYRVRPESCARPP